MPGIHLLDTRQMVTRVSRDYLKARNVYIQ